MARPSDVSNFGEAVYAQLAPLNDVDEVNNWALLIYIAAYAEMFRLMDDLAHSDPPWSLMVDVDNVPVEGLSWLGQLVGVTNNPNLAEADQRAQIRNPIGFGRGSKAALISIIQPYLTGTKKVIVVERNTSPYHFLIETYASETPTDLTLQNLYNSYATLQAFYLANATFETYWLSGGRNKIIAQINVEKPAALVYTFTVLPGSPP